MRLTEEQRERILANLSDPVEVREAQLEAKRTIDQLWGIDPDAPTEFIDFREIFANRSKDE